MLTILEGNKLIAHFMGKNIHYQEKYKEWICCDEDGKGCISFNSVLYHFSWEWLMPVVEQIESIIKPNSWYESDKNWFEIKSHSVNIHTSLFNKTLNILWVIVPNYTKDHRENVVATKKEAVYNTVLEFIEWYNKYK